MISRGNAPLNLTQKTKGCGLHNNDCFVFFHFTHVIYRKRFLVKLGVRGGGKFTCITNFRHVSLRFLFVGVTAQNSDGCWVQPCTCIRYSHVHVRVRDVHIL